jgi:hypothetical protein
VRGLLLLPNGSCGAQGKSKQQAALRINPREKSPHTFGLNHMQSKQKFSFPVQTFLDRRAQVIHPHIPCKSPGGTTGSSSLTLQPVSQIGLSGRRR